MIAIIRQNFQKNWITHFGVEALVMSDCFCNLFYILLNISQMKIGYFKQNNMQLGKRQMTPYCSCDSQVRSLCIYVTVQVQWWSLVHTEIRRCMIASETPY